MSATLPSLAARLQLLWVRIYTAGLAPGPREARRREISSDTYEQCHDPAYDGAPLRLAGELMLSWLAGLPDDLAWRASHFSVHGNLVQAAAASLPVAMFAGWMTYHISGASLLAIAVAAAAELCSTLGLFLFVRLEGTMADTYSTSSTSSGRNELLFVLVPSLLFPLLTITAMLIIPMASGDPVGDEVDLAERAAKTNRWTTGYSIYAVAFALGLFGFSGFCRVLRERGAMVLGTIAPLLFTVGTAAVIGAGHGAVGLGLAMAVDSGADGAAYLHGAEFIEDGPAIALSALGAVACALALFVFAAALWSSGLVRGGIRLVAVGAVVVEGVALGLVAGHGVGPASLEFPVAALVATGTLGWRLISDPREGYNRQLAGPPVVSQR